MRYVLHLHILYSLYISDLACVVGGGERGEDLLGSRGLEREQKLTDFGSCV